MEDGVDVAIVTYGGGNDLADCVAAVRAQGASVRRILVIDNASPDNTAAVADGLVGVEVIRNATNVGYAAAMNQAVQITTAPYLLSLNADCVLADGYIANCLKAAQHEPNVAAVTGVLRFADGRIDSTGIVLDDAGRAADRDRGATKPSTTDPFGVSGAAALWRRDALDALGPSPWWEWLFVYWDDVEIAFRLRAAGYRFVCALDAQATHRRGSDSADPDFIESQSLRNRVATLARHNRLFTPQALIVTATTVARLAVRHPNALRRAHVIQAIKTGRAARAI